MPAEIARELTSPPSFCRGCRGNFSARGLLLPTYGTLVCTTQAASDCDFDAIDAIFRGMVKKAIPAGAARHAAPQMSCAGSSTALCGPGIPDPDPERWRPMAARDRRRAACSTACTTAASASGGRRAGRYREPAADRDRPPPRSHLPDPRRRDGRGRTATSATRASRSPSAASLPGPNERERLARHVNSPEPATISEYASTALLSEDDELTVAGPGCELLIRIGAVAWEALMTRPTRPFHARSGAPTSLPAVAAMAVRPCSAPPTTMNSYEVQDYLLRALDAEWRLMPEPGGVRTSWPTSRRDPRRRLAR